MEEDGLESPGDHLSPEHSEVPKPIALAGREEQKVPVTKELTGHEAKTSGMGSCAATSRYTSISHASGLSGILKPIAQCKFLLRMQMTHGSTN